MGHYKNVVLSVKHQGVVRSWSGPRALVGFLVDPQLFADIPASGLLSDARSLDVPLLGKLLACELEPGSSGWIGLDADRQHVIDAQYYTDLGSYPAALENGGLAENAPDGLVRACMAGPWSTTPEISGARATHHQACATRQELDAAMSAATTTAWRKLQDKYGPTPGWSSMAIQVRLPWRKINCHPTSDEDQNLVRFARLLGTLERRGWSVPPRMMDSWIEYASRYGVSDAGIASLRAAHAARNLDQAFQAPCTRKLPAPRL